MVKLGRISRCGFFRFDGEAPPTPDPDLDLRDAVQRIGWSVRAMAGRGSRWSCVVKAGR